LQVTPNFKAYDRQECNECADGEKLEQWVKLTEITEHKCRSKFNGGNQRQVRNNCVYATAYQSRRKYFVLR
jgi:hypothetical protein